MIMWWDCCYFFLNRKRWLWRTRWINWSKGWEFVIAFFFSLVVCNGLQHFVRACTFCAILSQLALQHRYHEANIELLEQRRCWGIRNNWFKTPKSVEQNSVVITKIYLAWLYSWYRTDVFRLNFSQCKSQNVLRGRFWETSDLLKISRTPVTQTLKGKHFELAGNSSNRGKLRRNVGQGKGNLVRVSAEFELSEFELFMKGPLLLKVWATDFWSFS